MHRIKWNRLALLALLMAMAVALPALASDAPKATSNRAANDFAICCCGKIFVPDAKTEFISYGGKQYACCTHECHEMAAKDPAASAKMGEESAKRFMGQIANLKLGVGNVVAVTEKGTKAVCGCGKSFMVDDTTEYIQADGVSYACCTHACHEMAAKDPAAAAKMTQKVMAGL